MAEMYGFHVGKYTNRPMDPSWDILSDDPPILRETVGSIGMIGILQMVRNASDIRQLNAPARDVAKSHQKKNTSIFPVGNFKTHHLDEFHHQFIYNQGTDSQHTS